MAGRFRFDQTYYDRFYVDPKTRVSDARAIASLSTFVASYLKYVGQPVESVLDLGCGVGHWKKAIRRQFPKASYRGVELSDYLCKKFGWKKGSAVDYADGQRYDLVLCQGVLQYLSAAEARRAIRNLDRLSQGAVYIEALTRGDWKAKVDQSVTDGSVYLREAAWYRRELERRFTPIGGGLFLASDSSAVVFDLEALR